MSKNDVLADMTVRNAKLRAALQRIADLPLTQDGNRTEPNSRARRIAIAALGGDPQTDNRKPAN